MRRLRAAIAIALAAAAPTAEAARLIAVTNVTLLDGTGGPPRPGVTVLIAEERIKAIVPSNARLPTKARRIDARGRFLVPGFIDMHAHLMVPRCEPPSGQTSPFDSKLSKEILSKLLNFGITTVRSPATPTEAGLKLRDQLNAGELRGPRAFASAELLNDPKQSEAELRSYVRDSLKFRPDYFKVYARLSPEQVAVVVDEAHRYGIPVIGHLQRTSWAEGAALGIDHLTHAVDWSEKSLRPEHREPYVEAVTTRGPMRARLDWLELLDLESPEVNKTIAELVQRGISVDPTLVAYDTKFSDPASPRYRDNPFVAVSPELRRDWEKCGDVTADWTPEDRHRWSKVFPKLQRLVALMHAKGVLLTTGSDLTNEWVIPGESLHQEFELLREAGISPAAILKMTGQNAGKSLNAPDIGVIEAGRRADLVLLRHNPLSDISNSRSIIWVMQGGRLVAGPLLPPTR